MMNRSLVHKPVFPVMRNYRLTDILGTGTYATVYKGYKKSDHEEIVAVKCIQRIRLTKLTTENLFTEIEVMKALDHEHIVKLKDFEWDDKYIYLIMEYCSGGDLFTFIKNKTVLSEKDARKFLRQLGLALQFLYKKGIAHMDLKPQNLLLSGDGRPILKIADFGMAQHLRAGDSAESFRGSPLYMAPEIMLRHTYDATVDLWSVGVILYETLFGMAPFASKTVEELESKVLDQEPIKIPTSPAVSVECRDLLHRLLERDPNKRISFEEFFDHPFVDLEHVPGPSSLLKARELVTQAVTDDSEGNIKSALDNYRQAIEYFVPAMEYEEDSSTKEALRIKIEQYIERAEHLKEILGRKRPSLQHFKQEKLLDRLKTENSAVKAALIKASMAEQEEASKNFRHAFDLYQKAVELLIPVVEEITSIEYKKVLKSEIKLYLDRAEEVLLLSKQKSRLRLLGYLTNSATETSDSRCRIQ